VNSLRIFKSVFTKRGDRFLSSYFLILDRLGGSRVAFGLIKLALELGGF